MPRWSLGCEECRRRKIRCDQIRPSCQQCFKHGVSCPGYRERPKQGFKFTVLTPSTIVSSSHSTHSKIPKDRAKDLSSDALALRASRFDSKRISRNPLEAGDSDGSRLSDELLSYDEPLLPPQVNLAKLHRMQLLSSLAYQQLHTAGERSLSIVGAQLTSLALTDTNLPLLHRSLDALCLASISPSKQDRVLVEEYRSHYGMALSLLVNEVNSASKNRQRQKSALSAILLLAMCDRVQTSSTVAYKAWIAHIHGAEAFVNAMGPEAITSDFDWLLFHNIRLYSIFLALAERRSIIFAEPKWLAITADLARHDPWIAQQDLIAVATGLLERADRVIRKDSIAAVGNLVREIQNVRVSLQVWQNKLYINDPPYTAVSIDNYPLFANTKSPLPFRTAYRYKSASIFPHNPLAWITRLTLDCTLLRLMHFRGTLNIEQFLFSLTRGQIEEDAHSRAVDLCRSVPFLLTPDGRDIVQSARWYLEGAGGFFEEMGLADEAAWCANAMDMVRSMPHMHQSSDPFVRASMQISKAFRFRTEDLRLPVDAVS